MVRVIETKDLMKIYNYGTPGETAALNKVTFHADEGDFVTVMGPSGSGKSTFINVLSTLDFYTGGTVMLMGKDVRQMNSNEVARFRREHLGFVFQEFNLLDTETIYENIGLSAAMLKTDRRKITDRLQELAERFRIADILNKYPYECSAGQRQRAAICRALIHDPDIIMADEPTGALDSSNSFELMKIMKQLNDEQGVTIIMVTHDPLVASFSKRMIMIRDGSIEHEVVRGDMTQKEYLREINALQDAENEGLLSI